MSRSFREIKREIMTRENYLFSGKEGRDLDSIREHYLRADVQPRMVEEASSLLSVFQNVSPIIVSSGTFGNIVEEGGEIKYGTDMMSHCIRAYPDLSSSNDDFHFEIFDSRLTNDYMAFNSRPLPVRWRLNHMQERLIQRREDGVDFSDGKMIFPLAFTLALSVVMERRYNWKKIKEVPFAVPYDDGLCLGIASGRDKKDHYNRLLTIASEREEYMKLRPLEWVPEISMNVYTFIGEKEMSPQQRHLHEIMSRFWKDSDQFYALVSGFSSYAGSGSPESILDERVCSNYQKVLTELTRFIDSKLWRGTVRLPGVRSLGGGVLRPNC